MNESLDQAARVIEAERAQIGHEIHDGLLPLLFASSASLSGLIDHFGGDLPPDVRKRLEQALAWIEDAMQAGRRLLTEIYPPELQRTSWSLAAVDAVERLLGQSSERVNWQLEPSVHEVSEPVALAAYRIVVEAIRNAVGHGEASEVVVSGMQDDNELRVTVSDNGCGFDPDQIPAERFGVRAMRGRARLVGGNLRIESVSGGPTRVTFTLAKQP